MKKKYFIGFLPCILMLLFTALGMAQQVPNVTNSWFGNSFPHIDTHMPQGIEDVFVTTDGAVYSNVQWDEGGGQLTCVKDGVVTHGMGNHGWGRGGGIAITANSTYAYYSQLISNDGKMDANNTSYPNNNNIWHGVSRRNRADLNTATPFTGGKGGQHNSPAGSFLPIYTVSIAVDTLCILGLYANETELYVCGYDNTVKVYDANTMAVKRSWAVNNPRQIFMDAQGMLWIAIKQNATNDAPVTKIERYSSTGVKQSQEINLPTGSYLGDFCIDNNNRLLIGDVGQNERVLIYTNINTSPAQTATFGTQYGIYSGTPGLYAPLKFHQVRGIGTDNAGNIYIGNTQWYTEGQGYILESYTSSGTINWSRHCVFFGANVALNPTNDGQDAYAPVNHFTFDYSKPAGQEATLTAYTVNRYKYPDDVRLRLGLASKSFLRYYNGVKFLLTTDGDNGGYISIFRFNPSVDGEVAIPCVLFGDGIDYYPNAPDFPWLWRDLDADGQMDVNEYTITPPTWGMGSWVDANLTVWGADGYLYGNGGIYKTACTGLDAHGIPAYSPTIDIAAPAPFTSVDRMKYDPATDVMYLGGKTTSYPTVSHWKTMGRVIRRYNNWSTGDRTSLYEILVPFDNATPDCETTSFYVAGDYIFTAISRDGKSPTYGDLYFGQINIFNAATGAPVGFIRPPKDAWGEVGWFDMVECIDVIKRSNCEYIITGEEDYNAKEVMYRWCPTGKCTQTSALTGESVNPTKLH